MNILGGSIFDSFDGVEALKAKANDLFVKGDFVQAEAFYTQAILCEQTDKSLLSVLYSNRSAAYLSMEQPEKAVEDAITAIGLNPSYAKAYLRKAHSLTKIGDELGAYVTWMEAVDRCEGTSWLHKQVKDAKSRWTRHYTKAPVVSVLDLLARYELIGSNTRLKLSTLAHFWNFSSQDERLDYLKTFLNLIGGEGNISEETERLFCLDKMNAMPMHNYEDLPRSNIEPWCSFLESLPSCEKCLLLKEIWVLLTSFEQNLVIVDLKAFLNQSMSKDPENSLSKDLDDRLVLDEEK